MTTSAVLYLPADVLWKRVLARTTHTPRGCWLWDGALNSKGYGTIAAGRKGHTILVHRLALIVRDGHIPAGLTADHTCHNTDPTCPGGTDCLHRRCVNPDHLDPVPVAVNSQRGQQQNRATCKAGHLLTTRVRGDREVRCCRACENDQRRAVRAA